MTFVNSLQLLDILKGEDMYQRLVKLMEEHNETPAELSRATGISEALISTWKKRAIKNGKMSIDNAVKIADHYSISVSELMKE